jgi:hypothetical protein
MKETIIIKPHHFLDIIKLYGKGIEVFTPDKKYKHDFYRIGNIILNNKNVLLILTLDADDICKPCIFLKNGKCTDKIENHEPYTSKEEFNRLIDTRLLNQLGLKEGKEITTLEFCSIMKNRLNIFEIWKEEPKEKVAERQKNLLLGLEKYMNEPKNF